MDFAATQRTSELGARFQLQTQEIAKSTQAAMDRLQPAEPLWPRDLRSFWRVLQHRGFIGTPAEPRSASVPDLNNLAAMRARAILNEAEISSSENSAAR